MPLPTRMDNDYRDVETLLPGESRTYAIPLPDGDLDEVVVTRLDENWTRMFKVKASGELCFRRNAMCPCGSGKKFKRCCG